MTSKTPSNLTTAAALLLAAAALLASSSSATAAPTPAGKTYFIVALGLSSEDAVTYQSQAACLEFTETDVCVTGAACGSWWRIAEKPSKRFQSLLGLRFDVIDDASGLPIAIEGTGRFDGSGAKSSIGLVGYAIEPISQTPFNFSVAGQAVRAARCERLLADYVALQAEGGSR